MPDTFDELSSSHTTDYLLRNSQQELVALGGQADFKASVMITASSIVMSVVGLQIGDDDLGPAAVVLVGFLLIALLASVISVFPKFRSHRDVERGTFNPLFFGHYAGITKDEFLDRLGPLLDEPGASYRAIVSDLYDKGFYLVNAKYRYLRVSYLAFLLGFLLAAVTYGTTSIG